MNIAFAVKAYADAHQMGRVFAAETGFKLFSNPDTVRAPDVAFVSAALVPASAPDGYLPRAPDLAVEVLSPRDKPDRVRAKVADWLAAGAAIVWVVDPRKRTARVYRADGTESSIDSEGELLGESVLPGFFCALRDIV
jgi:Uma2 family endonuclease